MMFNISHKYIVSIVLLTIIIFSCPHWVIAQCPMCKTTVESSVKEGSRQPAGLNKGILYLLVMPYLALAGVGYLWYKKYRHKNVTTQLNRNPFQDADF